MQVFGMPVQVSPLLPIVPSPGEDGQRIVRHGMAKYLEWLGEKVGPKPGHVTECIAANDPISGATTLFVSRELYDSIRIDADWHTGIPSGPVLDVLYRARNQWLFDGNPLRAPAGHTARLYDSHFAPSPFFPGLW